ncbi:hypothetical protein EUTSA_v10024990mg [Eutrema salsugineum]|uniref:WPP domain-containing protein n=1 Tax=Eutrema salsugineum TaxID=72664 RepID=V4MNU1_EUTSA|nr:WPP domain-interacting protein 1 [Eutrema salsugineum]ESQ54633.1 hypothetical protein EUTSA_v10024990mg [Eutrema salsugineum]
MDLESESSALESVDDNGLIQQSSINTGDDGRSLDNGSFSDESVKLVTASTATTSENETSVELAKPVNFDSPGGAYSPVSKGRGLRKWRRLRRDLVKDTSANMENSKVLKRGLSGSAHSHGKQMQFQSPEAEQDSQGSVGSVNMLRNVVDGFEILRTGYDSRFMAGVGFSAGMDLEKDDDRSSKSSTAARAPKVIRYEKPMISSGQRGKIRVENSKKHRGDSVEIEKENSHSSLESDSRKPSGIMDYNGKNGDEADINGETSKRNDYAGGEGEDSRFSEELDPLVDTSYGFLSLQEALEKEVQQFREIGKEPMPQHHEGASEVNSPRSETVTLVNNVEQLEIKLEETRSMIEVKESHIRELESSTNQIKHSWGETGNIQAVVEDIFRQRIESEIEYLIYSRSIDNLNSQLKMTEEQEALAGEQAHETLNKLKEVETKAENLTNRAQDLQKECGETTGTIKKKACKTTSCFLIQLVLLLLTVVLLFMPQFLPDTDIVVPT